MRKYLIHFLGTDDGVETVEFIGLIVVTAVLIALAANVASDVTSTLNSEGKDSNTSIQKSYEKINDAGK